MHINYKRLANQLHAVSRKVVQAAQTMKAFSVLERQALLEETGATILEDIEKDIQTAKEWLAYVEASSKWLKGEQPNMLMPERPKSWLF